MRMLLLAVILGCTAACGTPPAAEGVLQEVRGLQIHYAPGVWAYAADEVEFLLDGLRLIYWHPVHTWDGMRVYLTEHPDCLVHTNLVHQLAHGLRRRWDGGYDGSHTDRRYWPGPPGAAVSVTERVSAWFAVQQCPPESF